jgi:hypothetical protein
MNNYVVQHYAPSLPKDAKEKDQVKSFPTTQKVNSKCQLILVKDMISQFVFIVILLLKRKLFKLITSKFLNGRKMVS